MRVLPFAIVAVLATLHISSPSPSFAGGLKIPGLKAPSVGDFTGELTKGMKIPKNVDAEAITNLGQYALKPPKKREEYVKVGEDILKVDKRSGKVIEVMGTAKDLKK